MSPIAYNNTNIEWHQLQVYHSLYLAINKASCFCILFNFFCLAHRSVHMVTFCAEDILPFFPGFFYIFWAVSFVLIGVLRIYIQIYSPYHIGLFRFLQQGKNLKIEISITMR
jgi:hypothetical protein